MHKIELSISHTDSRGVILDLVVGRMDAATLISFEVDAIRGNHVHAETTQWTYVLEGEIIAHSIKSDGQPISQTFGRGDMFVSFPGEPHAIKAKEKSQVIVFTQGPRSGEDYASDTKHFKLI